MKTDKEIIISDLVKRRIDFNVVHYEGWKVVLCYEKYQVNI